MKKYYEYQKVVSILLSFIVVISSSGCYSIKSLTRNDIQSANRTVYYLHGSDASYKLSNAVISEDFLTGSIDYVVSNTEKSKVINIYAAPDSSIKKNGDRVQVPFRNIVKVEVYKVDGLKTVIAVVGSISAAFVVVLLFELLAFHIGK